ncbi:MAG: DUF302 domain-containing protein [Gemmatimonadales bacterium]
MDDEPWRRMDGWMDGRRNVDVDGDRRTGGGCAGCRDNQSVHEIVLRSVPSRSVLFNQGGKHMLLKVTTDKTVNEAAAALQAAVQANHFGVMQIHNLKDTMTKKGVKFPQECLIVEVCEPHQAKKVLDDNMSVSTALPCRISIYEEDGKTTLATLKPTLLLAMFNSPRLEGVARDVEASIVKIMKQAVSK